MNEYNEHTNNGEVLRPQGFKAWLENFWYHYKWHSIIALFLIFTISICTFQMCRKEEYDLYVLYGGSKYISRKVEDGNFCEYDTITASFRQITKDYDENGALNVSFLDKYLLSDDELKEADDVNLSYIYQNNEAFRDLMFSSPYYICFLSDKLYLEYAETEGVFCPIAPYTGGFELDYLDDGAVYLHSDNLTFNTLPGICDLPENTVICLKSKTVISSFFSNKENEAHFLRSEESLKAIFAYGN